MRPAGFGLFRLLMSARIESVVAAPSKLQQPTGDRVKTDARNALHLARLLRLGEIVAVRVPSVEKETARDLVQDRDDVRQDLMSSRHRMSKLVLRHGFVYAGGAAWTARHDAWLRRHRQGDLAYTTAFDASYGAVVQTVARRDRLDATIEAMAADSPFTPLVTRLGCLRRVNTLTGFALAVEITDWRRFTGKTIGSFLGLVPMEYSSGNPGSSAGSPKPGTFTRRLLVEAAWQHRRDYRPGPTSVLQARWDNGPAEARLRGQAGNERLHDQWVRFIARKKRPVVASVAIARELAGCAGPWPSWAANQTSACGNQPAHISLTVNVDETRSTPHAPDDQQKRCPATITSDPVSPCPLDKQPHMSVDNEKERASLGT